jgi:CheY-like chemotaxis protein
MSPVDGLQCLEVIRSLPGYRSIPAIALTAYAHDVERKAFVAAGFQAVVTKPILDQQELFGSITALLHPHEPRAGSQR